METILPQATELLSKTVQFIEPFIAPSVKQAGAILLAVFFFALLFGVARRHMLTWSIKGAWFGLFLGIVLTLVVEAFLLVGGRTLLVETIKNERTPDVVRAFLAENLTELAHSLASAPKTLGAAGETPSGDVFLEFEALSKVEQQKVRQRICAP